MGSRSFFPLPPLLSSLLLLTLVSSVQAWVYVQRSNNTQDLAWTNSVRFQFERDSGPLSGHTLVPLTTILVDLTDRDLKTYKVTGTLDAVNPGNSLSLQNSLIACISCDPSAYPGLLGADQTVNNVVTAAQTADAVVLYSTSANHCKFAADEQTARRFPNVFTLVDAAAVSALLRDLQTTGNNRSVTIVSDMSMFGSSGSGPLPNSGASGNSPNTAMIILYSITGIITALFLGIIITGAVRAHRHPERYGPRRVAGRPRQSRARGIARAMLETIPIVKFDEANHDGVDAAKRDMEMSLASEESTHEHPPPRSPTAGESTPPETELATSNQPVEEPITTAPDAAPDLGNFSCPICTDDFIKGQDLRVLPCNHQFHPACVDPWLVNVSGTCPLCRIDLHPPPAEENAEQDGEPSERTEATDGVDTPTSAAQSRLSHRRLSIYLHGPLNARRMRYATVEERLAALRSVREANQTEGTAERRARSRLSARLRDRFRIRTRAHGAEGVNGDGEAATTTPAAPAVAHLAGRPASDT